MNIKDILFKKKTFPYLHEMSDNYDYYILATTLTVLLLLMTLQAVYPFFSRKQIIESMHSRCDSSMGCNDFTTHEPSVFSSFPKEKNRDNGYNYGTPLVNSCLSRNKNGDCDQEYTCVLTPHNERICHWNQK